VGLCGGVCEISSGVSGEGSRGRLPQKRKRGAENVLPQ